MAGTDLVDKKIRIQGHGIRISEELKQRHILRRALAGDDLTYARGRMADLARFEAALAAWGVGVAVVRGHAGGEAAGSMARRGLAFALPGEAAGVRGDAGLWPEEGIGPDENPDRGGRSRFAAVVAADASAVGLRGRRGE